MGVRLWECLDGEGGWGFEGSGGVGLVLGVMCVGRGALDSLYSKRRRTLLSGL